MFVFFRSAKAKVIVAGLALQFASISGAQAASSDSLVNAIRGAKIVDASVSVTAFIDGDQVRVSTYFSKNATDQDCKIDAVLISKAVMDVAPEVTRCKVYFYNSSNLREFKEVSVTSDEVKGFATRAINSDKILASLAVTSRHAVVTTDEMLAAIKKSGLLPPDARITARLEGDQANISTYRNRKASDQDCKIDAMLLSKVLIDLAPNDIARCNAYFFDSQDLLSYKQVPVTSGNVKAFGEGALGQDKLLASLTIKEGQISDPMAKVSNYLDEVQGAGLNTYFEVVINGNDLNISTALSPSVSDREAKLQGLMAAERALSVMPAAVTKVKVRFVDPGRKDSYREVVFDVGLVKSLVASLDSSLAPVALANIGKPQGIESRSAVAGILQSDRQSLLDRIKDLETKGVGITPFMAAFTAMEAEVPSGDEARVSGSLKRLTAAIESQEKAYKDAKDRPVTKAPVATAPAPTAPAQPHTGRRLSRYDAMGDMPITNAEILQDSDKVVAKVEAKLRSERINPDQSLRMFNALSYIAQVLSDMDRAADGAKYDQRAAGMRAANPRLK